MSNKLALCVMFLTPCIFANSAHAGSAREVTVLERLQAAAAARASQKSAGDATKGQQLNVDFQPLFSGLDESNTFNFISSNNLLDRVVLSPSLVSPAIRPTREESSPRAPQESKVFVEEDATNTWGSSIQPEMSTLLLEYLTQRGSSLVSPLASVRSWNSAWCVPAEALGADQAPPPCPNLSWVEQQVVAYGLAVDAGVQRSELPGALLALRSAGRQWEQPRVVVESMGEGQFVVRPRYFDDEPSLCASDLALDVPHFSLSLEVLDLSTAAVVARIDEQRMPKGIPLSLTQTSFEVERAQPAARAVCDQIQDLYAPIRLSLRQSMNEQGEAVLRQMVNDAQLDRPVASN